MKRGSTIAVWTVGAAFAYLMTVGDREIALWFGARFHGGALEQVIYKWFNLLHSLLPWLGVLAVVLVVGLRLRPGVPWLRHAASAGVALAAALLVTEIVKLTIGRSQIWPQFLQLGIYTLRPFSFDPGYTAFPSATMAGTTAVAMGLHLRPPAERMLVAAVVVVFAAVLFITSTHWASDVLGGTILGLSVGRTIARRFFPEPSRS